MKKSQLFITVAFIAILLAFNRLTAESFGESLLGGMPWQGWVGVLLFLALLCAGLIVRDAARARQLFEAPIAKSVDAHTSQLPEELREKYDPEGPPYPHPVVITERCIGCHACVEACPHGVLAMVNNYATPVAPDQCMEDTSCQVECPVNPKACIVVNTAKVIPPRKVPARDASFMTNVPGCYIIGDVSGTPLIKNAANEGADVIRHIADELRQNGAPPEARAEFDVIVIGVGPAGLSAAISAQKAGLRFVAVEQDRVLATIEAYPSNKYIFFKPETMESRGAFEVEGEGAQREVILDAWKRAMLSSGVRVNEQESCKSVRRAADGDYFHVQTEQGPDKRQVTYTARRVVLALGNRGTPMRMKVPGEDIKVTRDGRTEDKVKYKLADAESYRRQRVVVVGAGNSAVEAAVDFVARRHGDRISFRPADEINDVTLVIRSDMKNDLKFLNKLQIYDCIDEGRVKVFFGTAVKEIREGEVVLMNARTSEEVATIPNDYVFAMIGGDRPTKFLESIGIKIG